MSLISFMTRRTFLQSLAAVSGIGYVPGKAWCAVQNNAVESPTRRENQLPGTVEWQLQYTACEDPESLRAYPLIRRLRSIAIEGYADKQSLYPGETIHFYVSTHPEADYEIDIYRMGYYGGTGASHKVRLGGFKGRRQPMPMMTVERLRECDWSPAVPFTVPEDWISGVYLAKLTRAEAYGAQSYITFIVKDPNPADVLIQCSDLTWQAYNKWPGNNSLYDDGTPAVWYTGPNVRVSFDRPYAKYPQIIDAPGTVGTGGYLLWEYPLTYWFEEQGYHTTYCSNVDLELDPDYILRNKIFCSVAHDEYWSRGMFENATRALVQGVSLLFLSR